MGSRLDFALAIPTLNEAKNLPILLDRVEHSVAKLNLACEILIIDDDSRDGTAELAMEYAKTHDNVRLLVRRGQRGLAGAVIYGWQHTEAPLIGAMDADLQHPPELLPELVQKVCDGADIAIASRYTEKHPVSGMNVGRYAVSRLSTLVCMPLQRSGFRVQDPMSGFFVLQRHCIEGLDLKSEGFKLLLEILVRGKLKSAVEVPFQFGPRLAGKSKAGLGTGVHYLSLLGKLSRGVFREMRKAA